MSHSFLVFLLIVFMQTLVVIAVTNHQDLAILNSLKAVWENTPPSWGGSDPCGDGWEGIECTNSRVTSIKLSSMGLKGRLTRDITSLSKLKILDLSYNKDLTGRLPPSIGNLKELSNLILVGCSFYGPIPDSIGTLDQLIFLSLNSNSFSGGIPSSIGNLSNLYWLDLADNQLSGTIPVSDGSTSGLDMLVHAKHFHLGKNQLNGEIPPQLFNRDMVLIHVLFESNRLIGTIPDTLGLVKTLKVVRFDNNSLIGAIPSNLNELTSVQELYLSNNEFTGPLPSLTGMDLLSYLDMSNNSFDASSVPSWFQTLYSLTTLMMENTRLQGQVPAELFSLSHLQTLALKNNQLNGTLDITTSNSGPLQLVDLQHNFISDLEPLEEYNFELILVDNPICEETEAQAERKTYCKIVKSNSSYPISPNYCFPVTCNSDQVSSPNCVCAYPYTGTLVFRAPSSSNMKNKTYYESLEQSLMQSFQSNQLPVDSLSVSNPHMDLVNYLELSLEVFPLGQDHFNRTGISMLGFVLSNQSFKPPDEYGPFYFHGNDYAHFIEATIGSKKSLSTAIIIGAASAGALFLVLSLLVGVYAFMQKRRAERAYEQNYPFVHRNSNSSAHTMPQLKGARWFSFEELRKCTNDFSEVNNIGSGGYGKVYIGTLSTGEMIAIKRAQQGSVQGGLEFRTEIELLSRVHHKNLVRLLGFCFEKGEEILVYEYVYNGALKDSLSGKSGLRLDWMKRLKVALGAARGLAYLHDLANPPIIHRDIKSTNILLDERLNAKVADFGLSKPMDNCEKDHITTQVKGTLGYLDPDYYMTQQLTEKSDVYSFGVLMLELVTGKSPITSGKYIVREVRIAMDKEKDLYGLHELLDPAIIVGTTLKGFERFIDLAMRCVGEPSADRPTMSEVVKEIESIMQFAGLNPNAESASSSGTYEETRKETPHPYHSEDFVSTVANPP